MARDGARPTHDPAGHDAALLAALQDLRTALWMAMRGLLTDTVQSRQWTQRTQVLAAAAAGTDVVRAWLAEEPEGVPAASVPASTTPGETPRRPWV